MKTTNKKECPKCHSKKVIETRNGVGLDRGDGSYSLDPLGEVFYQCEDCHEPFSYKKE